MQNIRILGITLVLLTGLCTGHLSSGAERVQESIPRLLRYYSEINDPTIRQNLLGLAERVRDDISIIHASPQVEQAIEMAIQQNKLPNALLFLAGLSDIYKSFKENMGFMRRNQDLQPKFSLVGLVNQMRQGQGNQLQEEQVGPSLGSVNLWARKFLHDAEAKREFKLLVASALAQGTPVEVLIDQLNDLVGRVLNTSKEDEARRSKIYRVISLLVNVENARKKIKEANEVLNEKAKIARASDEPELAAIIMKIQKEAMQ